MCDPGDMRYVADAQTQERKLRAAESAAASAVGNGCDPDEVRRRVEIGIAEAIAYNNRQPGERITPEPPAPPASASKTRALDAFTRSVMG